MPDDVEYPKNFGKLVEQLQRNEAIYVMIGVDVVTAEDLEELLRAFSNCSLAVGGKDYEYIVLETRGQIRILAACPVITDGS